MALRFRNRVTGRVVTVAEPDELSRQLDRVTVRGRPLSEDQRKLAVKRRKRTLEKMGDAWKWQRVEGAADRQAGGDTKTSKATKATNAG